MSILVNLYKWGNAQGVLIPREILKEIGIDDLRNAKLVLDVKDDAIILKKELPQLAMKFGRMLRDICWMKNKLYIWDSYLSIMLR